MSLELVQESNLSLTDIQAAQQDGVSVIRSAHVGNLRGYNLAVADAGVPLLLVDHNLVAQTPEDAGDKNYLPGSIVTAEGIRPLDVAQLGGFVLRTLAADPTTGQRGYLDELHVGSMRAAFPNTTITTNTDYIRSEEAVSGEVIAVALKNAPELFTRVVETDGTIHRPYQGAADLVKRYGILQLNDDPRREAGVIIPNEVDVALNFVIEALRHGGTEQIHLSGPDFCRYAKEPEFQAQLNRLYAAIRTETSFGARLPESLRVRLVPATEARFVSAKSNGRALTEIFAALDAEDGLRPLRSEFFRTPAARDEDAKTAFLAEMRTREHSIREGLGRLVLAANELFIGPREAPYTSQYDVLSSGGLDMPRQNRELTMAELKQVYGRLLKARETA